MRFHTEICRASKNAALTHAITLSKYDRNLRKTSYFEFSTLFPTDFADLRRLPPHFPMPGGKFPFAGGSWE